MYISEYFGYFKEIFKNTNETFSQVKEVELISVLQDLKVVQGNENILTMKFGKGLNGNWNLRSTKKIRDIILMGLNLFQIVTTILKSRSIFQHIERF